MDEKHLKHAVKQLKKGNDAFFDIIYEATKTKVYYTILSILKDPSLSEDVMQDTYIKMIESIKSYQDKNQFQAWVNTIARNIALNTYNRRKKELLIDEDNTPDSIFGVVHSQSEKAYYLEKLIGTLSKDEQEVIVRHVILDEKHKDIAKALDKPLGTITWMYQNALKKIRKEAGEHDE